MRFIPKKVHPTTDKMNNKRIALKESASRKQIPANTIDESTIEKKAMLFDKSFGLMLDIVRYCTVENNREKPYVAYEVLVACHNEEKGISAEWKVYRRYSAFKRLSLRLNPQLLKQVGAFAWSKSSARDRSSEGDVYSLRACYMRDWLLKLAGILKNSSQPFDATMAMFLTEESDCLPFGTKNTKDLSIVFPTPDFSDSNENRNPNLGSDSVDGDMPTSGLRDMMSDYKPLFVVGKGSFGKVVVAKQRKPTEPEQLVAIKSLSKLNMIHRNQALRVDTERICMERANSPFIVKLYGAFKTESTLYLVQDYCEAGELYFHLERIGLFTNKVAMFYAAECVLALEHLHSLGIAYRDLKPENIMLCADGHIKLVDFGLAKLGIFDCASGARSLVGTTEYLSPEMISKRGHGFAVDWWSLGMVLYEMLSGLPPWYSEDKHEVVERITHQPLRFEGKMSNSARNLLAGLLVKNPYKRLGSKHGATDIKSHPYFDTIDWNLLATKQIKAPFIPKLKSSSDSKYFDHCFTSLSVNEEVSRPSWEEKQLMT